ncbi:MAG TPA: magnesium transporter CorA family protein, partial [Actinomycetota bacterium]|nr:magnesium transporter CorA family protein [Actinomycetota bacterium]
ADVTTMTDEDVATLAEEFDLHPLAVEDARHSRQRPKLESYEHHLFLVLHELDELGGQLEPRQISVFVGLRHVITLHEGAGRTVAAAKKRWHQDDERFGEGSAYLTHTLMDTIVDDYQGIADKLEGEIEELEDIVLEHPTAPIQRQLYSLKQRTARLRRFVFPLERVLQSMLDNSHEERIPTETHALFTDVLDHLLRIADQVRNIEDLATAAIDLQRAEGAQALNDVTKKLTAWAAIIAIPTLISGIYGMNLGIVPRVGSRTGFWEVLVLMVVLVGVMYFYFKKKTWI